MVNGNGNGNVICKGLLLLLLQISHIYQAKTWNGIFTVQGIRSTRTGRERTGQHAAGIGKPPEKTGPYSLKRELSALKKHWFTMEEELPMALEPIGSCMNIACSTLL